MSNFKSIVKSASKRAIYESYGIKYRNGKIYHPVFGWINPLLINGNAKLGKGVWTFSVLAANKEYTFTSNDKEYTLVGTCNCYCNGCYACNGCYKFRSTIASLGRKTWLVRNDLNFVYRAISAQIKADKITICRIHASGDFDVNFSGDKYLKVWQRIVSENPTTVFWTYTKVQEFENAFDSFPNANIVKSLINCGGLKGLNFGHCDYIINLYHALKAAGKSVYICRCGIDKSQHCTNCHSCAENDFVLFLEHGTSYKPEKDPLYSDFIKLVESQATSETKQAAN